MSGLPRSSSGQFTTRKAQEGGEGNNVEVEGGRGPLSENERDEPADWEDEREAPDQRTKRTGKPSDTRSNTTKGRRRTGTFDSRTSTPTGPSTNFVDPATFQHSMLQMMQMLTQSVANQNQPARSTASPGFFGTKEPKVKDPETFNGQRDLLNAFITECTLIFELQPSRFTNDRTMIGYMVALLRGTALMAVRPHLVAEIRPSFLLSYPVFIEYLKTNFGDPDEKGTARRKLKLLRQTSSASAYFSEFQQYIAILGWIDQDPIIDKAVEGLKPSLKDELARHGRRPDTLTELIEFVIPLDNRLFERDQERHREQGDKGIVAKKQGYNAVVTGNTVTSQVTSTKFTEPQLKSTTMTPQPSSNTTYQRTSGKLSEEVRQGRMDRGECLWCGIAGHLARDCPELKKRDQNRANLRAVREAANKNDEDESGNGESLSK